MEANAPIHRQKFTGALVIVYTDPEETFYCTCVYTAVSPLHYLVTRVGQVKAHQLPQSVIIRYAGDGHYAYPFFYNARIGCA